MQEAQDRNIRLSIMRRHFTTMFDDDPFVMPESFEEEDIDIFAELGVNDVRSVSGKSNQKQQQDENLAILLADNDADEIHGTENHDFGVDSSEFALIGGGASLLVAFVALLVPKVKNIA